MKAILWITAILALAIVSPTPALDRWQANYRAAVRASIGDYLPENPHSAQERALLREICALSDSALEEP
jgi:hypothetical protein